MKTTELDAFLKKKLSDIKITPQKDSWGKVQNILIKRQKERIRYRFATAACVLITLSAAFAFYQYADSFKNEKNVNNISIKENIIPTNSFTPLNPKEQISKTPLPEKIKKEKQKNISQNNTLRKQIHTNISATKEIYRLYKETEKTLPQDREAFFMENISYTLSEPKKLEIPPIIMSPISIPTNISKKRKNIWVSIVGFFQKAEDFHEKYSLENLLKQENKPQIEYAYLVEIKSNKKY